MEGEAVGWFEIGGPDNVSNGTYCNIEICGNEQFFLGRDADLCRFVWSDDLTISRQHLRIHCILYEQDPDAKVAPLIYATDLSSNGTLLKKNGIRDTASHVHGFLMGKNCTFLLDEGDELRLSDTVHLIYHSMVHREESDLTAFQKWEGNFFASRYYITSRLLGEGGNGKVLLGLNQGTRQQLACKVVRLDQLKKAPNLRAPSSNQSSNAAQQSKRWPKAATICFREFNILKDLSHPNIVTIEKVFWSHNTIYIFQELITGGDLFSYLEYMGSRLNDIQAAVIIRQILKGVEYLHERNIVHRDIKPDNILMTSLEVGARIVITDFGNARFLPKNNTNITAETEKIQRMFSYVGTLEFQAPEINRANKAIPQDEGYSKSIDMWSIGSVTALLLTGDHIFSDRAHPQYQDDPRSVIVALAASCDLSVLDEPYHPLWVRVGPRPKDFIRRLLVLDEAVRMTASQALEHAWFANESHATDYGDLYARSIQSWKPRERNARLVERIPDIQSLNSANNVFNEESVSHFFDASQSALNQDTSQKQMASQCRRSNSPFPFSSEEQKRFLFASQAQAPLSETSYVDIAHVSDDDDMSLIFEEIATGGLCDKIEIWGEENPGDCTNSSHNTSDDDSVQGRLDRDRQTLDSSEAQDSIQVAETPLTEQILLGSHNGYRITQRETSLQASFQDESGEREVSGEQRHSIIVLETPTDDQEQDQCLAQDGYSSSQDWVEYDPAADFDNE